MERTTIFLPDDLKADLKRISQETGRSVSDLIRDGAARLVADHATPARRPKVGFVIDGDPRWSDPEWIDQELRENFGRD